MDELPHYYLPSDLLEDSGTEPMDEVPRISNQFYFSWPPVRKFEHPRDGIISSRILPDESNLIRFSSNLECDFTIPSHPDESGLERMNSESFQSDYSALKDKPVVLHHGEIFLHVKQ
jgi:hypothetical protein